MTSTRHAAVPRRMLLAVPAALAVAALAGTPAVAATPSPAPTPIVLPAPTQAGGTAQGIIMRDGGVCDPIRHMGC